VTGKIERGDRKEKRVAGKQGKLSEPKKKDQSGKGEDQLRKRRDGRPKLQRKSKPDTLRATQQHTNGTELYNKQATSKKKKKTAVERQEVFLETHPRNTKTKKGALI